MSDQERQDELLDKDDRDAILARRRAFLAQAVALVVGTTVSAVTIHACACLSPPRSQDAQVDDASQDAGTRD